MRDHALGALFAVTAGLLLLMLLRQTLPCMGQTLWCVQDMLHLPSMGPVTPAFHLSLGHREPCMLVTFSFLSDIM